MYTARMITQRVPFVYSIVVLAIEFIYTVIMLVVSKIGNNIDYLVLALWSIPLLPLAIISLIGGFIHLKYEEVRKKAVATIIMGGSAIIYFAIYAICLGFLVGTGYLPHHYFPNGF